MLLRQCRNLLPALVCVSVLLGADFFKVVKSIPVPGEGGWDYLAADSSNRRLYVSHATAVDVLDLDTNALVGKIPNTNGVHGIALAPDLGKGFVSDGRDNQVTIFNLQTLQVTGTAKTGKNPDGILYDPFSKRVFTFNGRSNDATAIDAQTGEVVATIALGGKPEFPVTDGKGNAYVNIEDKSEIVHFNPKTLAIQARWSLSPQCESPSGLTMDVQSRRLFPVCDNKVMTVVDADSGKVITTVPTGDGTDAAAFDPARKLIFSSNGESGTLTVIKEDSPDKYRVLQNVKTQEGARTMALDLKKQTVYLSDAEFGPAPAATADRPHPRPSIKPGSFKLLVVSVK
jgi:YVTN family beta-propeller protein